MSPKGMVIACYDLIGSTNAMDADDIPLQYHGLPATATNQIQNAMRAILVATYGDALGVEVKHEMMSSHFDGPLTVKDLDGIAFQCQRTAKRGY